MVPHSGWVGASGASQWVGRGQWCLTVGGLGPVVPHSGWVGGSGASQGVGRGQWCLTVGG